MAKKTAVLSREQKARDASVVELIGARATIVTAMLALHGKGVMGDVETALHRFALQPIERAIAALSTD